MEFLGSMGGAAGSLLGYVIPFLAVLTVVVFIHELGHFLVGRWCGVGVTAFSVGFGPEIVGFNDRRGTRWKLSAIPLGGYVKFAGDINSASVPDADALSQMSAHERAVSFHHKPVWKRAAIVAAGPIANFLLAITLFAAISYVSGQQVLAPRIEAVQAGSAAERAGFQAGDLVLSIDDRPISGFGQMQRIISASAEDTLAFTVERGGREIVLNAVPDLKETQTPFGKQRIGLLGLQASRSPDDLKTVTFGVADSMAFGVRETRYVVERTMTYISRLVVGREYADQLSGPLRIAQVSGTVASLGGVSALISLVAVLSVSIGLINLFPIPLLDGGHLLFYGIEALRGRPLSDRAQEIGFRIGLAIVVMLMLFATWNDIVHLGSAFSSRGT
ncbi:MAG: Intramembrane protease RasP/YluC, implicated in cell division based on FtsL cleavage [uncultured Microvirga sp.]|uniref:Zinc metalloprotease n=1 Tax=uncultured Microvirga sp. TaxID=412392 RepID=A0A6J4LTB3_9HYPH|nr:MAG: Intramembrane protease RasP/YluC, implicated in cell division based on FtsL cleavage [uncultured Microvirga sp.]